ncbi:hypothetical protein MUY14_07260 [Amycolatopsis sp. FBCC-B4732]|uniref:hypothetical protein n=1 Tax=Amycolatopsis sp. FBCC-B4732 TaxID=3079339 RepID=UPI001FF44A1F|nr:hypothetical protein [Amycolatopsis sp. FBCC-B4732]UOX90415.1 hypothetical protein MUY14_07260 [Amycolatopsis sp. FBCC-B4732]
MTNGMSRRVELQIGTHQFPRMVEVQAQWSRTDDVRWLIDTEAMQWLFDRVAAGEIDSAQAQEWMRSVTGWESGCCTYCDSAAPSHAEAVRRMDELIARWNREQETVTPESHPYLLNKSRIHAWNCSIVNPIKPDNRLTTLHEYAIELDDWGSIDAMLKRYWENWMTTRRITAANLAARLERRNPNARDPRCKRCSPPLPGAYLSEASDVQSR